MPPQSAMWRGCATCCNTNQAARASIRLPATTMAREGSSEGVILTQLTASPTARRTWMGPPPATVGSASLVNGARAMTILSRTAASSHAIMPNRATPPWSGSGPVVRAGRHFTPRSDPDAEAPLATVLRIDWTTECSRAERNPGETKTPRGPAQAQMAASSSSQ